MSKVHIEVIIVLFLFTRYPMHGHEWAYLLWPVGKRIHLGKVAYYSQAKTETHIHVHSNQHFDRRIKRFNDCPQCYSRFRTLISVPFRSGV
uniref:Secreted protein n=1 Tax=Xiphophorus maculatus TaxID=8083 RepID=A0A3B5PXT8_XIPMA